jgi:glycine/D-amino acid oxidase-like deaminating enzyme
VPWNRIALHMKLAAYRTYAIAYPAPSAMPDGLYDDCQTPYHYIRTQITPRGRFLIVGGEDHKTGHERETQRCFERLESYARKHFALQGAAHRRWSGQILEPADGLPFIGRNALSKQVYVATGFSGTGVTFGTLAAMLLRDTIMHCDNPWAELYAATRIKPLAQAKRYLAENVDFPAHVIGDRLARGDVRDRAEVAKGQGKLVHENGKMLAVYRDDAGVLHTRSAVCPHLGCHVRWNDAERSWDCPCHGSRFSATGQLRNGPAVSDLAREDKH